MFPRTNPRHDALAPEPGVNHFMPMNLAAVLGITFVFRKGVVKVE